MCTMSNIVTKSEIMQEIYLYFREQEKMSLFVCDMGFAVLDAYFDNHPDRVFNMGIAEQATISMAAGMALTGMFPIVYSQIPFLTMRPFEQLRYDLNEHKMKVMLVGVGAENYFHQLGSSHCFDDKDTEIMAVLDNFKVFSPSIKSLKDDVAEAFAYDGPTYLRCR